MNQDTFKEYIRQTEPDKRDKGLKATSTSELLKKLLEGKIIKPVSGYGKGKYRPFLNKPLVLIRTVKKSKERYAVSALKTLKIR